MRVGAGMSSFQWKYTYMCNKQYTYSWMLAQPVPSNWLKRERGSLFVLVERQCLAGRALNKNKRNSMICIIVSIQWSLTLNFKQWCQFTKMTKEAFLTIHITKSTKRIQWCSLHHSVLWSVTVTFKQPVSVCEFYLSRIKISEAVFAVQ